MTAALADTSVFIARESGRPLDQEKLPNELAVSVVTAAELETGVLHAPDVESRWLRLNTLKLVTALELLEITPETAHVWAKLRYQLAKSNKRIRVNDLWIAAQALEHGLPVVTHDADFGAIAQVTGLEVFEV